MVALVDAAQRGDIPARPAVVISNRAQAPGLELAADRGVETLVIRHQEFGSRELFDRAVVAALQDRGVELVCLAGFMRLLSPFFVRSFTDRIINIHPSLLPSFPGLHVQQQALDHGAKVSGCTVHFVDEDLDAGPIIVQRTVPILEGDDADILAGRILDEEHRAYTDAVRLYFEDRLTVEGRMVRIRQE